jgi:hypothetical protein
MADHTCHATGCKVPVPPKMFLCRRHWFRLPKPMQAEIWDVYVPGQEQRKDPTPEYLEVAQRCIRYLERIEERTASDGN